MILVLNRKILKTLFNSGKRANKNIRTRLVILLKLNIHICSSFSSAISFCSFILFFSSVFFLPTFSFCSIQVVDFSPFLFFPSLITFCVSIRMHSQNESISVLLSLICFMRKLFLFGLLSYLLVFYPISFYFAHYFHICFI